MEVLVQVELKHTLTVDKSAWFIRFYVWLWEGDIKTITFCKLFWAYVFVVPGFLIRFGIYEPLSKWVIPWVDRRKARRDSTPKVARPKRYTMWPFLEVIETTGSKFVMRCSAIWNVAGLPPILGRILVALLVLAGVAAASTLVYVAATNFGTTQWVLVGILSVAAAVIVGAGLMALGVFERLGNGVAHGAHAAKRGVLGFRDVMAAGYVAVKSNICPRVEIK